MNKEREIASEAIESPPTGKAKPSPGLLAEMVRPAVGETLDQARSAAHLVLRDAGREARRTVDDGERASKRVIDHASAEVNLTLASIDDRLAKQQVAWRETHEELADSVMDRVVAVAVAAFMLYGAYYFESMRGEPVINPTAVAMYFWTTISLLSGLIWVLWRVLGRPHRLWHLLKWELYILGITSICAGLILLVAELTK